jgi:hypothetical protein
VPVQTCKAVEKLEKWRKEGLLWTTKELKQRYAS